DRIAERFVEMGARLIHLVDFDGARAGVPANLDAVGAIAARVAVPIPVAGGADSADAISRAFAAGATRVVLSTVIADRPDDLRACLAVAGDWLPPGLRPRPGRAGALPPGAAAPPARSRAGGARPAAGAGLGGGAGGRGVGAFGPPPRPRRARRREPRPHPRAGSV